MRLGQERTGEICTRAPVGGQDQPPRKAWWEQKALEGQAKCTPFLSWLAICSEYSPIPVQWGWDRVGRHPVGVSEFPMILFIPQAYGDIHISSRSLSESKYFIVYYFPFYFSKIVFYNTEIFNFL